MKQIYKFPFWLLMIPIILVSSVFVSTKLDAGALTQHEFNSTKHLIWTGNRANSDNREERILTPEETIESINKTSPEHVPAYILQLSLWTDVVGFDLVVLRTMSFFYYVLQCYGVLRVIFLMRRVGYLRLLFWRLQGTSSFTVMRYECMQ